MMHRLTRRAALATFLFAALAGCGDVTPEPPPPTLQGLALDTVYTIGAAQGQTWDAFGGIWDVAASASGHLAVLDIENSQVHVYDRNGTHVGSVTEEGLAEGALAQPAALAWRSGNELLVWDPGSSWISRFSVRRSSLRFADRWRAFAFGETGFCARGNRTYLSYWHDDLVVHEIGSEGPVRSFGPAPAIPGVETMGPELQEIAVEELSPSGLVCADDGVLDVAFFGSHLRFHYPDGMLAWSRNFADFNPLVVYTPDGMGLGRQFDATEGTHLLRSVVAWGEHHALVQHELLTDEFQDEGEPQVIESRLIRLSDGAEVDRTRDLPVVLATWGNRLFTTRHEPFPHVVAMEVVTGQR
jgi:hypothetical protein